MLFFPFPFDIDVDSVSRDLKQKPLYVESASITRLRTDSIKDISAIEFISKLNSPNSYSSLIDFHNYSVNTSTWNDFIDFDFDVVSEMTPKKSIKMTAKITKISTFKPKIVVD